MGVGVWSVVELQGNVNLRKSQEAVIYGSAYLIFSTESNEHSRFCL
jgi:hypothetical protein